MTELNLGDDVKQMCLWLNDLKPETAERLKEFFKQSEKERDWDKVPVAIFAIQVKSEKTKRVEELASQVKYHRFLYSGEKPLISDEEFDKLVEELRKLDPENEIFKE
jgi:hypothetical protein